MVQSDRREPYSKALLEYPQQETAMAMATLFLCNMRKHFADRG
jgi:hypothetical protein